MLNIAAAFGGGVYVKRALDNIALPSFQCAQGQTDEFKLSVRVIGAAALALKQPGVWSSQRPHLELSLGSTKKDTEFGDFADEESQMAPSTGVTAKECPWRFGDTVTFVATKKDLDGPGLRLRLRAQHDISLGPLQLQFRGVDELGEAIIDLKSRVLPACAKRGLGRCGRGRKACISSRLEEVPTAEAWESPLMLIPLFYVKGCVLSTQQALGQASTGHVAVVFSVNVDPESLLAAPFPEKRAFPDVLGDRADHVLRWFESPVSIGGDSHQDPWSDFPSKGVAQAAAVAVGPAPSTLSPCNDALATLKPREVVEAADRAGQRSRLHVITPAHSLLAPDLSPEGWISRKGPNGRLYWHHRDLGPAPWEESDNGLGVSPHLGASKRDALASYFCPDVTDLPRDGWVSHCGKDGRVFWHNTALGPPPWSLDCVSI